jgi:thiol peroxidase
MAKVHHEGGAYRTHGELPTVGSRAPDFSLVNTDLKDVTLANWLGMRKIFNIFPSIDTEICAKSVIAFDKYSKDYDDVAELMISYDLPFAHRRFFDKHALQRVVGLSAIRHMGFGENYGVQIIEGPLAGMFSRAVVVLDENNTVVHEEHIEDLAKEPNYVAAYQALGIQIED